MYDAIVHTAMMDAWYGYYKIYYSLLWEYNAGFGLEDAELLYLDAFEAYEREFFWWNPYAYEDFGDD